MTMLSAALAASAVALSAAPAGADPGARPAGPPSSDAQRGDAHGAQSTSSAKRTVDRLFHQAERATEKYNLAKEHTDELRDRVNVLHNRVARGQEKVNQLRGALGALAGAQYRSGGVDPSLTLLLTEDPDGFLTKSATLDRITNRHTGQLRMLRTAQRVLRQERTEAAGKLVELERSRKAVSQHKREVTAKLAAARTVLNGLTQAERDEVRRGERAQRTERQGRPDEQPGEAGVAGAVTVSSRAAAAVRAAQQAVGSPYAWGQAGPSAYDCSGLTQWAWHRAGVSVPRTSQGQAGAGQRVPLSQAQPGDLVVYRDDASHVGMYVGSGQVIHAPYPGAQVRYDPVQMMPVSSVNRP
ncbi:cell wall-associated NlpC family hydrolase [Streptomyces zagrosensis]|uniref:Cell wall-associated NlpC family hydrolase n=1 Tax=Streptomyces zagrosensis TaxID=1042984 RepID=A0A7W9UX80_9ACTN|nr:cell wall-associated NlpC family hydrolase [Streptomyces zagrosensis]